MWMTVAGVRAGRPTRPPTVLLTNRTRSAVLPIGVDDGSALEIARAHGDGVSAGGLDLLLAVVAACGARIHYVALGGSPGVGARARRLQLGDLTAALVLTDDRRVPLSAGAALALATCSGTPLDVPSPLRVGLVPIEPGVTTALAKNTVEDAVDALRALLDRVHASDFGHTA
jgi:hypothetical protein